MRGWLLQWLPESVRYLVAMGDMERALATLKRVADENGKPMPLGRLVEPVVTQQQEVRPQHNRDRIHNCSTI